MGVDVVEPLLVELILDGVLDGRIDQINGIFHQGSQSRYVELGWVLCCAVGCRVGDMCGHQCVTWHGHEGPRSSGGLDTAPRTAAVANRGHPAST